MSDEIFAYNIFTKYFELNIFCYLSTLVFFQVYGSLPSTPAPPVDISDLITEAYTNYNQITAEVIENMRFKQRMEVRQQFC